jgi:hypothetical protein
VGVEGFALDVSGRGAVWRLMALWSALFAAHAVREPQEQGGHHEDDGADGVDGGLDVLAHHAVDDDGQGGRARPGEHLLQVMRHGRASARTTTRFAFSSAANGSRRPSWPELRVEVQPFARSLLWQ